VGKADFKNLEAYITAALLYWALTILFSYFQSRLESRIGRGYDRAAVAKQMVGHGPQTSAAAEAEVPGPLRPQRPQPRSRPRSRPRSQAHLDAPPDGPGSSQPPAPGKERE